MLNPILLSIVPFLTSRGFPFSDLVSWISLFLSCSNDVRAARISSLPTYEGGGHTLPYKVSAYQGKFAVLLIDEAAHSLHLLSLETAQCSQPLVSCWTPLSAVDCPSQPHSITHPHSRPLNPQPRSVPTQLPVRTLHSAVSVGS